MSNVRDNPAASRFEMTSGGSTAFVEYRRAGNAPAPEFRRLCPGGVGSKMVRARPLPCGPDGLKVVPRCEFVAAFQRHPEYRDLLADAG